MNHSLNQMVGVKGFEPPTSCSQSRRATNCATPRYAVVLCTMALHDPYSLYDTNEKCLSITMWSVTYYTRRKISCQPQKPIVFCRKKEYNIFCNSCFRLLSTVFTAARSHQNGRSQAKEGSYAQKIQSGGGTAADRDGVFGIRDPSCCAG